LREGRFSNIYPQKWAQIFVLLGFCFFLYFLNLSQWDLWNPDEPRYAQVAREMVNGGDWILMHFNGKIYPDKPPLFFWLIALSSYFWQGFSSFSVRFPAALFGTFTVLLTFLLGKNLYSTRTGFFSGLILATSLQFAYLSTRANIDTTLTFFTTASLLCFFEWYQNTAPRPSPLPSGEREGVRGNWLKQKSTKGLLIYGFYISMALGTLTKGPVGFIIPLLISLIYLLIQKDWKGMRGMKLLPGMILFLVIVLSWYLPAVLKGGRDYLNVTLFKHTIDRYSTGWSHVKPIYYYLYNFPVDFLPWIFFLPAAMVYGYSREAIGKRREFIFLLAWFFVIFLFFSLSKGKRSLYLLPLYPAVSIMIGKLWNDFIFTPMEHFRPGWISFPLYGFMGLALIAGAAIPWVISMKFPSYLPYSLPIAFLMVGGSLVLFVLNRFRMQTAIFFLLIGMMASGFFYTLRVVFPLVNPYKSARFISQEITSRIQPAEKLALYGGFGTGPYNYYTGIVPILELEGEENLIHLLGSPERVFCILKFGDFSKFQVMVGRPEVQLITRRKVGDDDIVLISNR
jgi:4-amino-4-deoxy-L-arabinose transferase-like glycosyltransferase